MSKEKILTLEDLKDKIFTDVDGDYKNEFLKKEKVTKTYNKKTFNDRIDQLIFEVKTASESSEWVAKENNEESFEKFNKGLISFTVDYPNITRMMLYKIYAPRARFDCDVTKDALDELKLLYVDNIYKDYNCELKTQKGNPKKYEIILRKEDTTHIYRGDTMNSFWELFKSFLQNCCHEELGLVDKNGESGKFVPKYANGKHGLFGTNDEWNFKSWFHHICVKYGENNEIFNGQKELFNKFDKFAKLNHTIGNFMLVPFVYGLGKNDNYNNKRASKAVFHDCFDLSLADIKKFYDDQTAKIDFDNQTTIINYEKAKIDFWLNDYGKTAFEEFIKKNHLGMYVDENYNVHPLCKTIDRTDKIPTDQTEIENYLDNVIENIKSRNEAISNIKKTQTVEKVTD